MASNWKNEIANALAIQKKLTLAHNAKSALLRGKEKSIPEKNQAEWKRYKSEEYLPLSQKIGEKIAYLRANVPEEVKIEASKIVKNNKVSIAPTDWSEKIALLEASSTLFDIKDEKSAIVAKESDKVSNEISQNKLDLADITPTGEKVELPPDPLVDWTSAGWTEVDVAANRITFTANQITVTDLDRDEEVYFYRDYDADHFDGFSHDYDFKEVTGGAGWIVAPWCLANVVNDEYHFYVQYSVSLSCHLDNHVLYICNWQGRVYSGQAITRGTQYYVTVARSAGGILCTQTIYSDASRETIVGVPKSVAVISGNKYRYLYSMNSWNSSHGGYATDALINNLDIKEALPITRSQACIF